MSPIVDLHLFYTGNVQGVGFRYTVKQIAAGYEVTGWIRNLPDGRVELQASGEKPEVEAFLAAVAGGQLKRHIKQTESNVAELGGERTPGFEIRH